MSDDSSRGEATRRIRRRVAYGHASARRQYLTPELRAEAHKLREMLDEAIRRHVTDKERRRVKRIRAGATPRQSRYRNWQQTVIHDDE